MSEIFSYQHRVTYSECTLGNHIYYARYLDILEAARGELFRAAGLNFVDLQNQDFIFPVTDVRLKYKAPARYDDLLRVELWLTQLTRVRLTFACRILNQAQVLLVEGETGHVCTGVNEKPRRAPDDIIEKLKAYFQESSAA